MGVVCDILNCGRSLPCCQEPSSPANEKKGITLAVGREWPAPDLEIVSEDGRLGNKK